MGAKQDVIAAELSITQQAVSDLEKHEQLGNEILGKIAKALNISVNDIINFNEESVVRAIIHTPNKSALVCRNCHQSIQDKIDTLIEKIERLYCAQQGTNDLLFKLLEK